MRKVLLLSILCFFSVYSSKNLFAQNGACVPSIGIDCGTAPNFIDSVVTSFATSNFSNIGTDCNTQDQNYNDYENHLAIESPGGSFNLHVGLNPSFPAFLGVWIDWNNDLNFGSGEQVFLSSGQITTTNITVNVPISAVSDTLILRVRCASISPGPCDSVSTGETEDYRLLVLDPTGIGSSFFNEDWTIYPNPANDVLTVDLGKTSGSPEISVIDLLGNVLRSEIINNGKTVLDLSALPHGMYFVRVNVNGKSSVKKFVH